MAFIFPRGREVVKFFLPLRHRVIQILDGIDDKENLNTKKEFFFLKIIIKK